MSFETPSHNIACEIATFGDDTDEARCDIKQAAWTSPPKPASCQYAWGMALHVTSGGPGFDCVGDTADNDQVVPYGSVEEAGQFRCVVETTGVTCTDTATGHGYAVSKAAYRLF